MALCDVSCLLVHPQIASKIAHAIAAHLRFGICVLRLLIEVQLLEVCFVNVTNLLYAKLQAVYTTLPSSVATP